MTDTPQPLPDTAPLTTEDQVTMARDLSRMANQAPVPVDPDLAEAMGAFQEDALSLEDALDSLLDGEAPADGA